MTAGQIIQIRLGGVMAAEVFFLPKCMEATIVRGDGPLAGGIFKQKCSQNNPPDSSISSTVGCSASYVQHARAVCRAHGKSTVSFCHEK
jgi:hypothetical protein